MGGQQHCEAMLAARPDLIDAKNETSGETGFELSLLDE